jgi:transcriptional regulator with XRE-family HTH domain
VEKSRGPAPSCSLPCKLLVKCSRRIERTSCWFNQDRDVHKLGEFLKGRRTALGLAQSSLARRLGIAPSYVNKIEEGERRPSLKLIPRIADALLLDRQKLLCAAFPEAKELIPSSQSSQFTKSTRSWLSFARNEALLARYHVTSDELQTLARTFSGTSLSSKQLLAVLLLMRDMQE